uniref:Biogenesis of lysosome-related organelles complex 1 subunit 5 n=1 Tax=Plectus sambesii TaxID=2011161 RepID=A0A914WCD7_9BILA
MSFANIIKDIGTIYQRLFDHQPVLQGECAYFYHQFEGNGRSAEFDSLLQSSHLLNEAVDTELEERMKNVPFEKINAKLEGVSAMIGRIVAKGQSTHEEYIKSMQEVREKEWTEFEAELARKRQEMEDQTEAHLIDFKGQHEKVEKAAVRL